MAYEWLLALEIPLIAAIIIIASQSGVFVPLPMGTVRKMLKLAKIRKSDVLYDLGCGDGRIIVTAAREYGINAVGIENNWLLTWLCNNGINRNKVSDKIKLINGNLFKQDLSNASIVTVYLTQKLNDKLKSKLERELKKGTRVISASHVFKGWREIKRIKTGHFYTYLYKI